MIPASYRGNSSVQDRFCRQAVGDNLEGLVVATSYNVWLLGNSTLEGFESVSLPVLWISPALLARQPEEIVSLTFLFAAWFLAGSTRVAVILNPPAGPLRRFDSNRLVTGLVLVRVLRCCE